MMDYYGYGMGAFGWIGMILFWVLIVLAIVWLWRTLDLGQTLHRSGFGKSGADESPRKALDIAKERYAKGEISKEDFEQLKQDLS